MLKRYPKFFGFLTALVGVVFYVFWSGFDVPLPDTSDVTIEIESINESNDDSDLGINILTFAPALTPQDYASPKHLKTSLRPYFEAAKQAGIISENTIVLLPAHTMTPLLFTGYGSRVYNAHSIAAGSMSIIAQNLIEFSKNYFIFDSDRPMAAAFVRTQSASAARAIQNVFGGLAKEYGVHIVPGSGLLMTPGIHPGTLTYGHGPIFHTSFMFGPDGKAMGDAIRQVEPGPQVKGLVKASLAEFLPIFKIGEKSVLVSIGDGQLLGEIRPDVDIALAVNFAEQPTNQYTTPRVSISSNATGWQYQTNKAEVAITGLVSASKAVDNNTVYNISF